MKSGAVSDYDSTAAVPEGSLQPAHSNGFWWEVGNGLARTTLVTYLARELGADGFVIGLILASPHLVGVLRLVSPAILRRFPNYRGFCVTLFAASAAALMALPIMAGPGFMPSKSASLGVLVGLWGLWHLLLYLGVIALYAWFGELVLRGARGRFLGRRESWRMTGAIIGSVTAGLFALAWTMNQTKETHWLAYGIPAFFGGVMMLLSNLPLVDLPLPKPRVTELAAADVAEWNILSLLARPPLRQFLCFACWGAFANGVSMAAVGLFAPVVLKVPVLVVLMLESGMRLGQAGSARWIGSLLDRWGNRGVLITSQLIIAGSLLFLLPAGRNSPWWLALVYVAWIAYAGLNIGLPRTTLQLSSRSDAPSVIALYYAATGLAVGLGAICGGIAFESVGRNWAWTIPGSALKLDRFQVFFVVGVLLRMTAVLPLLRWSDPDSAK